MTGIFPLERFSLIWRFIKQEGAASATLRAVAGLAGLIYRQESVYILTRPISGATGTHSTAGGITFALLNEEQIDQLAIIAYNKRAEIARRLKEGQKCIIAKHKDCIVHYSWLAPKSEYAGEIEMKIPVKAGEIYLYNCRTLASARGQGIFPAVIARALDESGKSGAENMIALVSQNNKSSLKAFEKLQFCIREKISMTRFLTFRKYRTGKYENHD